MRLGWFEKALLIQDTLPRKLYVVGILAREPAKEGVEPVVVGGLAVEWHTRSLCQSADVDLLCPGAPLDRALPAMGFEREGRHRFHAALRVAVEAPASRLEACRDRTTTVEVEGVTARLPSVEGACVHGRSELDCEQALHMMVVHRGALDWACFEQRAPRRGARGVRGAPEARRRDPE